MILINNDDKKTALKVLTALKLMVELYEEITKDDIVRYGWNINSDAKRIITEADANKLFTVLP